MSDREDDLKVRPAPRPPLHASIDERQISDLVDIFYDRIWADPRLGPIFSGRIGEDRSAHLAKMKRFWSSVLLRTASYDGRPMPAHMKLTEVESEDFQRWLGLFRPVAREVFEPEAAALVIETAERIATSFWLAMFGTPFNNPPELQTSPRGA